MVRGLYEGRCHCGAVRFEVRTELEGLVRCNCSLCARRSAVMHYVVPSNFTLISGEGQVATYRLGHRSAAHRFCKVCGIFPSSYPTGAGSDTTTWSTLAVLKASILAGRRLR
jgi:hypothetical protein